MFDIGIKYCFEIENILIYKIYCIIYLCKLILKKLMNDVNKVMIYVIFK